MNPLISLVSGTYNRLPMLKDMVQSFRDNLLLGIEYEVVLVDGGSTDGTIQWARAQSDVSLIEDGALLGAISAFTSGAKAANGKYVLLANDDVTFKPDSILPAIVHLENNLKCGAVAYKDNRPMGQYDRTTYKTNAVIGVMNGQRVNLIYAQVGLFRKWLGDRCNWWLGEHNEMQGAQVYGGDNSLSAQIWRYGYSVDEVEGCTVEDHIANDELREINYRKGIESNDSHFFFDQYDWSHGGIQVPSDPQIPQQDRRAARILYLPIYEPGWTVQKHPIHGKRGLRDALGRAKNKYGTTHIVQEFDYLGAEPKQIRTQLLDIANAFKPDLILTQIQSPVPITGAMLDELRKLTGATVVNWNGDQAFGGLASPEMLALLRHVDLQLITNLDVVPTYEQSGIKWAYWQIGYEESEGDLDENVASYFKELGRINRFETLLDSIPVVYLASLRTDERMAIAKIVQEFGGIVSSPGDEFATLYNFTTAQALYHRAKVIISDNGFTSRGFVSNRLFQALASGGGVVLQQHVDGLDELTGLIAGFHYAEWRTLDDLRFKIKSLLDPENEIIRDEYRYNGTKFVRENFSFDAQVDKLMQLIKEKLGESTQLRESVSLQYVGKNTGSFGLGNAFPSGQRYEYEAGRLLYVRSEDVETILNWYPNEFQRMEIE